MSASIVPAPASAPLSASSTYKPQGQSELQSLFHERFPAFETAYEGKYADEDGRHRLPLIAKAAAAFDACGDWANGIARIRYTRCGFDYFRPFFCKSLFLCPPADRSEPSSSASTCPTTFSSACITGMVSSHQTLGLVLNSL